MKSIETKVERVVIGRIMPDEDLIDAITEMVKKYEIKAGLINVIGALKKTTIGYFQMKTSKYNFTTLDTPVELISCMGNVAWKDDEPVIHLHVTIGKEDYSIMGGHLSQPSIISITAEVYIYEIGQKLVRTNEPQFNLPLLKL